MRFTLFAVGILGAALAQTACKRDSETSSPSGECDGMCGRGTRCDGKLCVVDYSQDICASPETNETPVVPMKPPITSWGECFEDRSTMPKFKPVDDKSIAQFDPDAARRVDLNGNGGDEQLNEAVLNSHMRDVEYAINDCLAKAACYQGSSLPNGRMDFTFRLLGTGKVESITVAAPTGLSVFGIIPCARKAVVDHVFPTYDGPAMTVKYNIEIGGSD
ncbi:MAG: hypothetical protein IPO88_25145 [Nannocystis sp.]|uniref:hypothetical protein n=1 Tax=Nannocystis sp. TaxID=1962667 RepID=UPI0024294A5F|nr:hypothetical protein [Nannocystis sp.]MBK9756726.1 hypothetical protein [Nannocystis sp.]